MSVILEILLEVAFNVIGFILEAIADVWLPALTCEDTKAGRIILGVIVNILAVIISCELR